MAWRIEESVIRGEIDNRVKGVVRGAVWVEGCPRPVTLELEGDACPDLAGCLLTFTNPRAPVRLRDAAALGSVQRGRIGDLTASRKVRVPSVPLERFLNWPKEQGRPPSHWANCLYLEWFSEANVRVIIESAEYRLTISAPEWRLTPDEEARRARDAAAGWEDFMRRLTAEIERHGLEQKDPELEEWDEHDYERFLRESDARTTKYGELLDKHGDSGESEGIIEKEMGWSQESTPEDAEAKRQWIEEMNAASEEALSEPPPEPDPAREGIDWIRTEAGQVAHPLERRCFESSLRFLRAVEECLGDRFEDEDVERFVFEFHTAGAKLAGALGAIAEGGAVPDPAFTVAHLKRALDHLHRAQAGLEGAKGRLPGGLVGEARAELLGIREELLVLMDRLRGRG